MKASRDLICGSLTLALLLTSVAESRGLKMARPMMNAPVQQAAGADTVVLGTVVALEPDFVQFSQFIGGPKVNYLVAVVKVQETLLGSKGITHVRVGFVPTAQNNGYYGENEAMFNGRMSYRNGTVTTSLREGQEGCFFLVRHHEGDFFAMPQYSAPLNKNHSFFDDEFKQVKRVVKVLQNPTEALQAKESTERQLAAAVLVHRYRTAPQVTGNGQNPSPVKTVPISEEESKLILAGLGEMTWGEMGLDGQGALSLQTLFWQLSLTDKEGWRQPAVKENEDYNTVMDAAVKQWLKTAGSKYRLQRYIVERKKTVE